MNQSELIELSKAAAKVAGIESYRKMEGLLSDPFWLHEDSARCFELMCRYGVYPVQSSYKDKVSIFCEGLWITTLNWDGEHYFFDHDGNKEQATRVAILKAIVAIGERK